MRLSIQPILWDAVWREFAMVQAFHWALLSTFKTTPRKTSPRIKTPNPQLMILVSFYSKKEMSTQLNKHQWHVIVINNIIEITRHRCSVLSGLYNLWKDYRPTIQQNLKHLDRHYASPHLLKSEQLWRQLKRNSIAILEETGREHLLPPPPPHGKIKMNYT